MILVCKLCSKEFEVKSYRAKSRKYCSKACNMKNIVANRVWTVEQRVMVGDRYRGKRMSLQEIEKMRKSPAWKSKEVIFSDYSSGYAIVWLCKKYKADKRTIRSILKECGVKNFRGRAGIQAWNKGKPSKLRGDKSPQWRGGVTPLNMKVRRCLKYKEWVKTILKRDNFTCNTCLVRGGNLEVDHYPIKFSTIMSSIKTFEDAEKNEKLWNIENGRTLCLSCHNKTKNQVSKL